MTQAESTRWLIIPVEVQAREWLGRLLVGAVAASRGYRVLIGHDRVVRRLARHLPKGVLFDKSLGMRGDRKVAMYHRLGYTLTALDEEMTGIYPNPDYFFGIRLASDTLAKAQRWFTISKIAHDMAVERYPGNETKFTVTGLPRTDIWRPAFHQVFENERREIAQRHGRFILFCSNFGRILHARRDDLVAKQSRVQESKWQGAAAYQDNLEKQLHANLAAYIEMLPKLREWFPGHRLVIRPHPSEDRGFWRETFANVDGVFVEDEGIATPWILASDVLVHHGCTTGIEAELMDKPQVMYAPHPDDHHDTELMSDLSTIVKTEPELREVLTRVIDGSERLRSDIASREKWFAAASGKLASQRIIDEFEGLASQTRSDLPAYLGALRFAPRHLWARYGPRSAKATAYSRQKWSGQSLESARRQLATLQEGADIRAPLELREVFPQLFEIKGAPNG